MYKIIFERGNYFFISAKTKKDAKLKCKELHPECIKWKIDYIERVS